ncbi:hypothetical protein [Asanoa sp. NPDC050611]|uniref:hypothetical protein n=1 Tax=Asanoa sp. NPDC050611 TaxID=3157098 RepID=UPI0033DAC9E9
MNRLVLVVLRSGARALLDHRICALIYRLPRSGRIVELPVRYAAVGNVVLVAVGRPDAKTWWHAFHEPWPVSVLLQGQTREGVGRVLNLTQPGHRAALLIYTVAVGRAVRPETPVVVIDTVDASDATPERG